VYYFFALFTINKNHLKRVRAVRVVVYLGENMLIFIEWNKSNAKIKTGWCNFVCELFMNDSGHLIETL
jgi:hypothetical protein